MEHRKTPSSKAEKGYASHQIFSFIVWPFHLFTFHVSLFTTLRASRFKRFTFHRAFFIVRGHKAIQDSLFVINTLLLIFDPVGTWERIIRAQRSIPFILLVHLLPLLIMAGAAEGFELARWGYKDRFGVATPLNASHVIAFEAAQAVALLVLLLGAAQAVKGMGETFNARKTFKQALTVVAYGIGPVLLARLFLVMPGLQPWMRWMPFIVGVLLSLAILYHGVPRVMALDPTNAFGLYLTTVLVIILATGAVYLSAFLILDRNRAYLTG